MKRVSVFIFVFFFFALITGVVATPFTPTSSPTGTNAGQNSQLVNFSIQNIGNANITQLNITLPPTFTFTGTSGTTTSSPYTASSSAPSWINSSSIGIVGDSATQYFWIYTNTPTTTGSYSFNVTTLDTNGVFNSSNVTFTLFDTLAPTYSSNTTSPSTNTTYAANQPYWINITWTDGVGISKVLLEHNFTGSSSVHNETMSNSSSVYYFNVTDLSAGSYLWRVYANDTNNTFNSTPQFTYSVPQALNELKIYLNGSLNRNITSINNTAVNITVNASCNQPTCTISILRDGTSIATSQPNPYSTNNVITSIGLHNYSVSVSGNANYTSNSTTYFVATTPGYSTSTANIPLTFSNTTAGTINIVFDSNPSLVSATIQGDWSGTATNYTMSNTSGLSFYYNTTFPAGTNIWKIYAVYANHSFNLTTSNSFTINKAAPSITLSITPEWTLDSPVQTNVTCRIGVSGLTLALYKNGTSITTPDVQTFPAGSIYVYLCNNTVNQNYTTNTATNTLVIKPKSSASLIFVQAPTIIEVVQNSSNVSEIKIKNIGPIAQNVTLQLSGIDADWYSLNQMTTNIFAGSNATFTATFKVGNVDVKGYSGKFNVSSTNATISQDFTLRVLPSEETKLKINDTIAIYKLDASKLENRLNESKTKISNVAEIEQKITELKSKLKQAEDYINSNDYFSAQQTSETIKPLISEIENQLEITEAGSKVRVSSRILLPIVGVVIVVAVGVATYLFWPVKKGYTPGTGYTYTGGERKGLFNVFKNLVSKFKRKKKTEPVSLS